MRLLTRFSLIPALILLACQAQPLLAQTPINPCRRPSLSLSAAPGDSIAVSISGLRCAIVTRTDSTGLKATRDTLGQVRSQLGQTQAALATTQTTLTATRDTLTTTRGLLRVAQDSLAKWPKPCRCDSTVTPPPPPPADSGKDSTITTPADTSKPTGSRVLFNGDFSKLSALPAENKPAIAGWKRWGGQGILSLVSATGLGFPATMGKVVRVSMGTSAFDWLEAQDSAWTLPAVGQSRAFVVYYLNATSGNQSAWSASHPIESKGTDGSISGNFYAWHIDNGGHWAFATEADYPRNYLTLRASGDVGTLPKNQVLRVEWKWTATAPRTYSLDMRIYDASGALIHDNKDIIGWGGNPLASNNKGFPLDDWAITGLRIGSNGGYTASGTQNVYWGGFKVCTDWCGAYTSP